MWASTHPHVYPAAAEAFNPLLKPLDAKLSKYIGSPLRIVHTAADYVLPWLMDTPRTANHERQVF